jgi:hypothetical protein
MKQTDKDTWPWLRPIEPLLSVEMRFSVATGVPIPEGERHERESIVNRKIKMTLFDEVKEVFFSNSCYVNVEWTEKEEDKWRFPDPSKGSTNPIMFTTKDFDLVEQNHTSIVMEFIVEQKLGDEVTDFSCGWSSIPLKDLKDKKSRPKTLKLEIKGGSIDAEDKINHQNYK